MPLHDVWALDLPGGGPDRRVAELRALFDPARANRATRALFALRRGIGTLLRWDRHSPGIPETSYLHRLSADEREASEVEPGTPEGPFRVLYVLPREAVSEVRNATVHAFSVFALMPSAAGYRFYWAIHVRSVGALTGLYMRAIDPFRRAIVYPSILRALRRGWDEIR